MTRRVVSREAITGLLRSQMTLLAGCARCDCAGIRWARAADGECNWALAGIQGRGCLDCLGQLGPLLESLKANFDIEVPLRRPLSFERAAARFTVEPRAVACAKTAMTEELIAQARAAVRESRAILQTLAVTNQKMETQCAAARRACESSRRLMQHA